MTLTEKLKNTILDFLKKKTEDILFADYTKLKRMIHSEMKGKHFSDLDQEAKKLFEQLGSKLSECIIHNTSSLILTGLGAPFKAANVAIDCLAELPIVKKGVKKLKETFNSLCETLSRDPLINTTLAVANQALVEPMAKKYQSFKDQLSHVAGTVAKMAEPLGDKFRGFKNDVAKGPGMIANTDLKKLRQELGKELKSLCNRMCNTLRDMGVLESLQKAKNTLSQAVIDYVVAPAKQAAKHVARGVESVKQAAREAAKGVKAVAGGSYAHTAAGAKSPGAHHR